MARTKKQDREQKPFIVPDDTTTELTSLKGIPPQNQAAAQIMADPEKREYASHLLKALTDSFKMEPVKSNQEMADRMIQYFEFSAERKTLPTMEGMALFLGYSRPTLRDWRTGRNKGFSDLYLGLSTSQLVQKALTVLESFDADMAMRQKVSPVTYIFRAKAISGYEDRHVIEIEANDTSSRPLTPEEIAKNLPEMIDDGMIDLLNEVNE